MSHHSISQDAFAAQSFTMRQVAQACVLALLAGAGGAAMAQQAAPAPSLQEVTVSAEAAGPEQLPPAAPGGQVATGARLGVLGNVEVKDAHSTSPPSRPKASPTSRPRRSARC